MNISDLVVEQWLARRLQLGLNWASGVTTADQRRETIRLAILKKGIAEQRAGFRKGYPETWAQLFRRIYRQPLHPMETEADAV